MLLLGGCVELPLPAKQELVQAEELYNKRDYTSAKSKLDQILNTYPQYRESSEGYYLRALVYNQISNMSAAQSDLRKAVELSLKPDLTARANAMAGALAFESGNFDEAGKRFEAALRVLPERPPYDLVRYRYGVCLQRKGEWKQARSQFATLLQKYQGTSLRDQAQRMLDWGKDYFSIQCGAYRENGPASGQASRLKAAGLPARVETRRRTGELLHMVYVGQYAKFEMAQSALGNVRRHAPGATIVPQ